MAPLGSPVEGLQSNVTPNNLWRVIPEELLHTESYKIRVHTLSRELLCSLLLLLD